jgi:hypothetical protein
MFLPLTEHMWKCLNVISRPNDFDFQKSRVTCPWDHVDSVSAKKVKKISFFCTFKKTSHCVYIEHDLLLLFSTQLRGEPVFLNVYGAQDSILRNEFRQPMEPGGPVR